MRKSSLKLCFRFSKLGVYWLELVNTLFAELSASKETIQDPHTSDLKVLEISPSLQFAKSCTEFMG